MTNETRVDGAVEELVSQAVLDAEIASSYGLVAVRAYVKDAEHAKAKTKNAQRQAKFVAQKTEQGFVKEYVPASILTAVKEAGGWETWILSLKAPSASLPPVHVSGVQPAGSPAPVAINPLVVSEAEALYKRVQALRGAKAWLVRQLLK
jgi:hypothetical protein